MEIVISGDKIIIHCWLMGPPGPRESHRDCYDLFFSIFGITLEIARKDI